MHGKTKKKLISRYISQISHTHCLRHAPSYPTATVGACTLSSENCEITGDTAKF